MSVLAVTSGLLFMLALCLYCFSYGFSVRNSRVYNVYLGIEFAFQLPAYNIKMHLSQPAYLHLVCFFVF